MTATKEKEYVCQECGIKFVSTKGSCPHCGSHDCQETNQ